jgi:dihydroorotase
MRIVLEQATMLASDGTSQIADLYLLDGQIEGLDLGGDVDESFDASGKIVAPAFVDLHTRLGVPGGEVREDLSSGLGAAVAGGFGTVVTMPSTDPAIDEPALVRMLCHESEALGLARIRPSAALSRGCKGRHMTDFAALQEAGAVMLTDSPSAIADPVLFRRACEYASALGLVIQTHPEDPVLVQDGIMNEGVWSQRLGVPGRPVAAEAMHIYRNCEIALLTGARLHIAQVSSRRGLQVIEWFQEQGANVTAEVSPAHLLLTEECFARFDPVFKVEPPLRAQSDALYLQEALQRGALSAIVSAHAPFTREEKERDLNHAPAGIASLELVFPLLYTHLVKTGSMSLSALLHYLHRGPAQVMGWDGPDLSPGQPADVVVLDLEEQHDVDPTSLVSKAKLTPWNGMTLSGWPVATFVRGVRVF